ncbi:MAG: tetratricopeptide repeat protein [Melioribacteraceae bacterium]|nr:tetratricopeptide repeat protein [Melioribacteraceae bacterium]
MNNNTNIAFAEQLFQQGTEFLQNGKFAEAENSLKESVQLNPDDFRTFNHLGIVYQNLQKFNLAADCFKMAVKLNKQSINAYNNLGICYFQLGNISEAESVLSKSYNIDPDNPDTTFNLGLIYQHSNNLTNAKKFYKRTIELNANFTDAYLNLGVVLQDEKNYGEAISVYNEALKFSPDNAELIFSSGFLFEILKDYSRAKEYYEKAVALTPNFTKCLFNLANVYKELKEWEKAEKEYRKVIELDSSYADAYINLGVCLNRLEKYEEAIDSFTIANSKVPGSTGALINLGAVLLTAGFPEKAISKYDEALSLDPKEQITHFNRGVALLLNGDFEEGWKEYEWRLNNSCGYPENKSAKLWNGEDLNGKTLLIKEEQGVGDLIQFIRYAGLLHKEGAKIIVQCRNFLHNLMQDFYGIDEVISPESQPSYYDFEISIMSLPYVFKTDYFSVPQQFPYLKIDQGKIKNWKSGLKSGKPNIGLIWKGNPDHLYDHLRSFKLEEFENLLINERFNFISLQKDITEEEKIILEKYNVKTYQEDFAATAAIISSLDLVISVDTAIAHLAGALNKPVWNLLSYNPDWRWLLDGNTTPWYSSMKLFRQKRGELRPGFVDKINKELENNFSVKPNIVASDLVQIKILALESHKEGNINEAEKLYETILEIDPNDNEINYWLGIVKKSKLDYEKSRKYFEKITENSEYFLLAQKELAVYYEELKDYEKAILSYKQIIDREKNCPAIKNLGNIYFRLKDYYHAEEVYKNALKITPNDFDLVNNLGMVLQRQNKLQESEIYFFQADQLQPNHQGVIYNIGNNFHLQQKLESAIDYYNKAISINTNFRDAHVSKGFVHLLKEDFVNGWEEFEHCVNKRPELSKNGAAKYWKGEKGNNQNIYVYAEQGLGDTIQFARFLPLVAQRGFNIIFECTKKLEPLFAGKNCISTFIDKDSNFFESLNFEYYTSILSLPRIFETTTENIPDAFNIYSINNIAKTYDDELPTDKLKVGVTWQGNPNHGNDHNRSLDVKLLKNIFNNKNVQFYSIQEKYNEETALFIKQFANVKKILPGFDNLISLSNNLDLIITVDTMTAHLGGILGKEVWTLLSYVPDWRWLLDKEKSAWYPSMRLFRQDEPGNWNSVFVKVEREFSSWLNNKDSLNISPEADLLEKGKEYLNNHQIEKGKTAFREILRVNENNHEAHFFLAYSYQLLNEHIKAIEYYQNAINLKPDYLMAYNNVGLVLNDLGEFDEAILCYNACLQISPDNHLVYNNLALVSEFKGDFENAVKYAQKAIELKNDFAGAYLNLATSYQSLNKTEKAIEAINRSLEINPDYVEANFNKAIILLKEKNFEEGLKYYEWRTQYNDYPKRHFSKPFLEDQSISGKTILVYDEQGYGDTIMFARYIELLDSKGANVILECHKSLESLLAGTNGVKSVIERSSFDEPNVEYDYRIPLLSLPKYFKTNFETIPAKTPYIHVKEDLIEKWKVELSGIDKFKIGIVWEGRMPINNKHRAIKLDEFEQLSKLDEVQLFSLQIGDASERDQKTIQKMDIISLSDNIGDFSDTAAIIKSMDLVIAIDTSVAHLAGSVGSTVWTLLSTKSDWRWFREIEQSPWYPTMKLYRQTWYGNWNKVIKKIMDDLKSRLLNIHFKEKQNGIQSKH